jgi:hypothetical protein
VRGTHAQEQCNKRVFPRSILHIQSTSRARAGGPLAVVCPGLLSCVKARHSVCLSLSLCQCVTLTPERGSIVSHCTSAHFQRLAAFCYQLTPHSSRAGAATINKPAVARQRPSRDRSHRSRSPCLTLKLQLPAASHFVGNQGRTKYPWIRAALCAAEISRTYGGGRQGPFTISPSQSRSVFSLRPFTSVFFFFKIYV